MRTAHPDLCRRRILSGAAALVLPACAGDRQAAGLLAAMRSRPIVLLGEVHDNAVQHALRLEAFTALLAGGARPALLMEQLDSDRQDAINAVRAGGPPADADAVIAAAGGSVGSGWDWAFYRPFVALALANGLPLVAANVSRAEARRVVADGLAAHGFDAAVPAAVQAAQAAAIVAGHCGMIDTAAATRMAAAQVARDQRMARLLGAHAGRGAVLLAGNGHVRTDIGAPRWLALSVRARTVAIGVVEDAGAGDAPFDYVVTTPRQPRADPCAALRRPAAPTS